MSVKVKYKGGTKKITLLRNLCAKLAYHPLGWSVDEAYVVYDLHDLMYQQASKDQEFNNKYGLWLNTLGGILKELNPQSYPFKLKSTVDFESSLKSLLPSRSAFYGWEKNPVKVKSYTLSLNLKLPKIKTSSFKIGVGYRDKGSAKNKAKDGSPSWQDVAQRNSKRDRIISTQIRNTIDWAKNKNRKPTRAESLIEVLNGIN